MPRKRSWVWNYCTKTDDGLTATCNLCDEEFQTKGSTSSLNKHLRTVHECTDKDAKHLKQSRDNDMETDTGNPENGSIEDEIVNNLCTDGISDATTSAAQPYFSENSIELASASSSFVASTPLSRSRRIIKAKRSKKISPCNKAKAETIDQALVKLIVTNMLPISFVESPGFKNFMAVVEPGYTVPCSETVTKRIDLLYNITKEKIKKELETASSVVAVSDCWSSRAQDAYLTVSAHYLSENWEPKSVCLATQEADERHSAENLCLRMTEIIQDYDLQNKIAAVVTDNAANAVNSVELMEFVEETVDVQCAAHSLQLAIHDGFKIEFIKKLCSKASKVVGHFKHSNVASYALEEKQKQLGLKVLKLIQNCPTRWNSTFFMIERLLQNRSAIQAVLADRKVTKTQRAVTLDICEIEWKQLEDIAETLKPLQLATTVLSAETSCISLVRPLIRTLIDNHLQVITDGDENINDFRITISMSLDIRFNMTYEDNISARQIASFLDPRYKDLDSETLENKKCIRETVRQQILDTSPSPSSCNAESTQSALDILFKKSVAIDSDSAADEFVRYLSEPSISHNHCPFSWWKNNAEKFSRFVPLARKYLALPATSTSSERVFSIAGNIVSNKRCNLHPENVDKLVFLYQNRLFLN